MENKVGDSFPNHATMTKLLKQLTDIITEIKKFGVMVSVEERRRLLRPRKEGAVIVQRVSELASKYKVALPNIPLDGMSNDQILAQEMSPFVNAFEEGLQLSEDTLSQAGHEAWQACLMYYGVLSSMASHNPSLEHELAPIKEMMTTYRAKKATDKNTKP